MYGKSVFEGRRRELKNRGGGVGVHGGESPTSSTSLGEVQSKRNVEADGLDVKPQEPS